MTGEQKKSIIELRKQGLGGAKIAARLGLSANTVKSYIKRNGLQASSGTVNETQGTQCPECGAVIADTKGRQDRRFCSTACRLAWWAANRNLLNRRAWYTLVCAGCGKEFQSYGNDKRKYCGHGCYIRARFGKVAVAQ